MHVTGVTAGTVWVYCGYAISDAFSNGKLITVNGSGGQTGKSVEVIFYVHQENMGTDTYKCSGVTFSDGSPIRPGNQDEGELHPKKDYVVILNNNKYWSINATDTDNDGVVSNEELKAYLQNNPSKHPDTESAKRAVEDVADQYHWTLNFDLNGYKDGDKGIQVDSVAWNPYDEAFHVDLELQPKTFDIVFHGEGGTYDGNDTKTEHWTYTPAGYEVPSDNEGFDREGYEFDEWTLAEESSLIIGENGKIHAAQDFDLYANWIEKQYTINYEMEPVSGAGTLTCATETVNAVTGNGPQGSIASVTDDTYEFSGWFKGDDQVGTDPTFVPSSRETATYTAKFAKKQTYSVTALGDSHVTIENVSQSSVYADGSSTVTWSVADGYVTDKVTVNDMLQSGITGNSLTINNIRESKNVYITTKGEPTSYTVEYYYEGADGYPSTATSKSTRTGERFASVSVADDDKTPDPKKSGYEFDGTNPNNVLTIPSLATTVNGK